MKGHDNASTNSNNNIKSTQQQFYDEDSPQQQFNNNNNNSNNNNRQQQLTQKRPLTLDLNGGKPPNKRQRFNSAVNSVSVLNSPDLQMLKMASPELEKFIMANNTIETPTPSLVYPTKVSPQYFIIMFAYTFC